MAWISTFYPDNIVFKLVSSKYSFNSEYFKSSQYITLVLLKLSGECVHFETDRIAKKVRHVNDWTNSPYVCYRIIGRNTPKGKVYV